MAGPLQVCSFTLVFSSLATMCPSEVFSFCFITYLFWYSFLILKPNFLNMKLVSFSNLGIFSANISYLAFLILILFFCCST